MAHQGINDKDFQTAWTEVQWMIMLHPPVVCTCSSNCCLICTSLLSQVMLALSPSLLFIADSATAKNNKRAVEDRVASVDNRATSSRSSGSDRAVLTERAPIKAAFISSNFYDHSIGLILIEMILYLQKDHPALDVYVYFIDKHIPTNTPVIINGSTITLQPSTQPPTQAQASAAIEYWRHDRITDAFEMHLGTRFVRVPDNIYTIRAVLDAAGLDFLLFSDLGMDFSTYQVAFSRLATYQVHTKCLLLLLLISTALA